MARPIPRLAPVTSATFPAHDDPMSSPSPSARADATGRALHTVVAPVPGYAAAIRATRPSRRTRASSASRCTRAPVAGQDPLEAVVGGQAGQRTGLLGPRVPAGPAEGGEVPLLVAPGQRVAGEGVAPVHARRRPSRGCGRERGRPPRRAPARSARRAPPSSRSVANGAAEPVVAVDPDARAEALGPAAGVGHVVAVGEQDVGEAARLGERAGQGLGVPGGVHEEVAVRSCHEPGGGPERALGAVAAVVDAGAGFDLPRVEPPGTGPAVEGADRGGGAGLGRQPGPLLGSGPVGLRGDDRLGGRHAEEVGRQLPAGPAVDAAVVDEPGTGGVRRVAQGDAGHGRRLPTPRPDPSAPRGPGRVIRGGAGPRSGDVTATATAPQRPGPPDAVPRWGGGGARSLVWSRRWSPSAWRSSSAGSCGGHGRPWCRSARS